MLTAEEVATEMGLAVDEIDQAKGMSIAKAEKTTLTVNEQAQIGNDELITIATLLSTSFRGAMDNIHSAAKEFERTDMELAASIGKAPHQSMASDK